MLRRAGNPCYGGRVPEQHAIQLGGNRGPVEGVVGQAGLLPRVLRASYATTSVTNSHPFANQQGLSLTHPLTDGDAARREPACHADCHDEQLFTQLEPLGKLERLPFECRLPARYEA